MKQRYDRETISSRCRLNKIRAQNEKKKDASQDCTSRIEKPRLGIEKRDSAHQRGINMFCRRGKKSPLCLRQEKKHFITLPAIGYLR